MATQFHEDFRRDSGEPKATERSFGLVFTGVFVLIGLLPLLSSHSPRLWALSVAVAFCVLAFAAPKLLAPWNRVWMFIGKMMHKAVSPFVLGLLFAVAVVPTGLFLRLKGSDPLRLKRDPTAKSYWITRDPPGPEPISFKNQF
jgi:Saxitoxin biosynthesis operon protein SxtJ